MNKKITFTEALLLLKKGKRVISQKDKQSYDQQCLSINNEGLIIYMNEPWNPSPGWLLDYMQDEWIDVEKDCEYHDHDSAGKCIN